MCPWCKEKTCPHFAGWTEDGRTLEPLASAMPDKDRVIRSDDRCVNTGVSCRVYRPVEFPILNEAGIKAIQEAD